MYQGNCLDTLSRAPIESEVDKECEEEVEAVMEVCICQLPATSSRKCICDSSTRRFSLFKSKGVLSTRLAREEGTAHSILERESRIINWQ